MVLQAAYKAHLMAEEVRRTEDWVEPFFSTWDDRMARYVGPGWRQNEEEEAYDPENFAAEWMGLFAPQCTLGNPRVRVKTSRAGTAQDWAKGHERALNRWIRATKARNLNEKLVGDYGFIWAVALVVPAEEGELLKEREDPRGWPVAKRISPRRFLWDVLALEKEDARWKGHKTINDKDDLKKRADENPDEHWDTEALDLLTEGEGIESERGKKSDAVADRNEVVVYNIWVPEYEPTRADIKRHGSEAWKRKGVNGAWLTLGRSQTEGEGEGRWIRHPYPYWGRRAGPYSWWGTYIVPDEAATLAPIPAVQGQDEETNDHARALSRAMQNYKKGILVDGTDPDWEDKIREFEDHWVVALEGLDKIQDKVKEIELGGATEMHLAHQEILKQRRNRASGITDAQRGNPNRNVTATAEAEASEKSDTRTGWVVHKFRGGVADYLESVSWYIDKDARVIIDMGPESAGEWVDEEGTAVERPLWQGGYEEGDEDYEDPWDAMGLEIEPYSMETTSEGLQQKRAIEILQAVGALVPLMAQFPFVRWDELVATFGEWMNMPNLGDYFDMDALAQFREEMLQMGMNAQPGGAQAQARLPQDMGPGLRPGGGGGGGGGGAGANPVLGQLQGMLTGATLGAGSAA